MPTNRQLLSFNDANRRNQLKTEGAQWHESFEERLITNPILKGLDDSDPNLPKRFKDYELVISTCKAFKDLKQRLSIVLGEDKTLNLRTLTIENASILSESEILGFINLFPTLQSLHLYAYKGQSIIHFLANANVKMIGTFPHQRIQRTENLIQQRKASILTKSPHPLSSPPPKSVWFSLLVSISLFYVGLYKLTIGIKETCNTKIAQRCRYVLNDKTIPPSFLMATSIMLTLSLIFFAYKKASSEHQKAIRTSDH